MRGDKRGQVIILPTSDAVRPWPKVTKMESIFFSLAYVNHVKLESNSFMGFSGKLTSQPIPGGAVRLDQIIKSPGYLWWLDKQVSTI